MFAAYMERRRVRRQIEMAALLSMIAMNDREIERLRTEQEAPCRACEGHDRATSPTS